MKLYIETTVPNFLFAEDAPEKRRVAEVFFDWLRISADELFISKVVEDEIAACPEPKRSRMVTACKGYP